jgi:alginate O-acetyltransferase complex protein AlgI
VVSLLAQKPWNKFAKNSGLTKRKKLYRNLKISVTFFLVCFSYIFFRAETLGDAAYMVTHLFSGWGDVVTGIRAVAAGQLPELLLSLLGIAIVMAPELHKDHAKSGAIYRALPSWQRGSLIYAATLAVVVLGAYNNADQQFIYFRF